MRRYDRDLNVFGVRVRMCSIVAALSKSECLKQSLNFRCLASSSLVGSFDGSGVKSDKTLSLFCMVRRKMPCELVALTLMSRSSVCACANEHGMIRKGWLEGIGIARREVKFYDPCKTSRSESVCLGRLH